MGHAYVQDRIAADADIVRSLIARGGQIMVCGARQMAQGLARALEEIVKPLASISLRSRCRADMSKMSVDRAKPLQQRTHLISGETMDTRYTARFVAD
jgi:hypothetical protein